MQLWSKALKAALFVLSLFVPAWKSLEAIESPNSIDDRQWLSYWLVYAITAMLERALWPILQWVPFYMEVKVAISAWLVMPQFKGALYTLQLHVLPHVLALRDYLRTIPALQEALGGSDGADWSTPKSMPTSPLSARSSTDIAEKHAQAEALLAQARRVLDSRLTSLESAKARGNVFELKMAEKALHKSMERLNKVISKGAAEDSINRHGAVNKQGLLSPRDRHRFGAAADENAVPNGL
ncbi:unnamed protein product [Ostreobium quekettii]|uniref:HVA22-like protein n=1 Tax=Ostreobium quekettii TaxID=121088 RepID=A0A8S1IPD9_9CHLO|nr:unnamed protein product [Ostreobium quekettii]|eukprot:evm.model.scf_96.2 EVM.evm.TU.scf_96.2   scf_96:51323-57147(-)